MNEALQEVLDDPRVWRAGRRDLRWPTLSSGYPQLDAWLPDGGWPAGRLTEVAVERWGSGELALFMPLLARLCGTGENAGEGKGAGPARAAGWIAWIAPPFLPYAPALAAAGVDPARLLLVRPADDEAALWAAEQALRSGSCRLVLAWAERARPACLRRLQLAAEAGRAPLVLFRPPAALARPSTAALRLSLSAGEGGAHLRLLKQHGNASQALPVASLRAQ